MMYASGWRGIRAEGSTVSASSSLLLRSSGTPGSGVFAMGQGGGGRGLESYIITKLLLDDTTEFTASLL